MQFVFIMQRLGPYDEKLGNKSSNTVQLSYNRYEFVHFFSFPHLEKKCRVNHGKNPFGTVKSMSNHSCCCMNHGKCRVYRDIMHRKDSGLAGPKKNAVSSVLSYQPWSYKPCSTVHENRSYMNNGST